MAFLSILLLVLGVLIIVGTLKAKIKNPTGSLVDEEIINKRKKEGVVAGVVLVVVGFFLWPSGSTDNNTPTASYKNIDTTKLISVNQKVSDSINKIEPADLFNDRDILIRNIHYFDPSLSDFESIPNDVATEAKDAINNRVDINGSGKLVNSVSWIYNGREASPINIRTKINLRSFAQLTCGKEGLAWLNTELKKNTAKYGFDLTDSLKVGNKEMVFHNMNQLVVTLKISLNFN